MTVWYLECEKKVRESALNKMVEHANWKDAIQYIELSKAMYQNVAIRTFFACDESY